MPKIDLVKNIGVGSNMSDRMDVESSKKSSNKRRMTSPPRRYLMPLLELEREA